MNLVPGSPVQILRRGTTDRRNAVVVRVLGPNLIKVRELTEYSRTSLETLPDIQLGWVCDHPPKPKHLDREFTLRHKLKWVTMLRYAKAFAAAQYPPINHQEFMDCVNYTAALRKAALCCTPRQQGILRSLPNFSHMV